MELNLGTETALSDDGREQGTPTPPPLSPDQLAPHFPQLEIVECLGRGGMGVVYKARQKALGRWVALKLLAPERVHDSRFAERFRREAQALAALNHPNIVTIHDFGEAGGFYFLLMEYVDGVNLRDLLRSRKLSPSEALAIVPPLCDALQYAHEQGIVHRDIKPENLLLDKQGRVKVADFGIARMMGAPTTDASVSPEHQAEVLAATAARVGTPGYAAPEQRADAPQVDHRADIYSLGVVLYEMLTGERPGEQIVPPSKRVQVDVRLDEIVLRALDKSPELRFQAVSELRTQVETLVERQPNLAGVRAEGPRPERAPLPPPPIPLIVLGGIFVLLALLGLWQVIRDLSEDRRTVNFITLLLPVGVGLIRSRSPWRRVALGFVLSGVVLGLGGALALVGWQSRVFVADVQMRGVSLEGWQRMAVGGLLCGLVLFGSIWAFRFLRRAEVKARFEHPEALARRGWIEWSLVGALAVFGAWVAIGRSDRPGAPLVIESRVTPASGWSEFHVQLSPYQAVAVPSGRWEPVPSFARRSRVTPAIEGRLQEWMQARDLDLVRLDPDHLYGACQDVMTLPPEAWEAAKPASLAQPLRPTAPTQLVWFREPAGDTFLARTRSGRLATLRVRPGAPGDTLRLEIRLQPELPRRSVAIPWTNRPAVLVEPLEPPRLRFVAWQDQWEQKEGGAVVRPDGTWVAGSVESSLLRQVYPPGFDPGPLRFASRPLFLHLWFSHRYFDRQSLNRVRFLSANGEPILTPPGLGFAAGRSQPQAQNENLGWLTFTGSPGFEDAAPSVLRVILEFTMGPMERLQDIPVTFRGAMSLEGEGHLNGIGQNTDGNAFLSIAVDDLKLGRRQFCAVAVTREGQELEPVGGAEGGTEGAGVRVISFEFETPLTEVVRFRLGTRPIRHQEWPNVLLPPR